jgi:hypothetical protein
MIVGIDPGVKGGIAALGHRFPMVFPMPLHADDIDVVSLQRLLRGASVVALERVHAMPGQGVSSMFTFGKGYGKVIAAIELMDVPIVFITPQAWKAGLGIAGKKKKKKKDGLTSTDWCASNYPQVNLIPDRCRVPSDGLADALCIAHYYNRFFHRKE